MPKYQVIRPWNGVEKDEIIELKTLHPAWKANVREVRQAAKLTPATPTAGGDEKDRKALIVARLKELKADFDARKSADDLAALLPAGELEKLFPAK